jgi:hypothetical protein
MALDFAAPGALATASPGIASSLMWRMPPVGATPLYRALSAPASLLSQITRGMSSCPLLAKLERPSDKSAPPDFLWVNASAEGLDGLSLKAFLNKKSHWCDSKFLMLKNYSVIRIRVPRYLSY